MTKTARDPGGAPDGRGRRAAGGTGALTRREALRWLGVGVPAAAAALAACTSGALEARGAAAAGELSGELPLRGRAARAGLLYGAAVQSAHLRASSSAPDHREAIAQECSLVVPEWELKWDALRPAPDRFDFTAPDAILAFARAHGMALRGHTLVWHQALPPWFASTVTPGNAERLLTEHIDAVVGRYRGALHSWDVVNEAIEVSDGRADGLRDSIWLGRLPGYLEVAFHAARAADPDVLLVYNDYGLEADGAWHAARRGACLALLRRLLDAGAPVGALGLQAHLDAGATFAALPGFLAQVKALGLEVLVTELDVSDAREGPTAARDAAIADTYARLLSATLGCGVRCRAVLTWGLSDRYSWLQSFKPRPGGQRPLPLDDALRRKPAWKALASAFDRAAQS